MNQLLTPKEVADYLKVSTSTVYRLCKRGLPHINKTFGIRIREEDLDKWFDLDKRTFRLAENILQNALTNPPPIVIDNAEGGEKVARKKTRHNYGYGSIYVRFTKKGVPRYYIEYCDKSRKRIQRLAKSATSWDEAKSVLDNAVYNVLSQELEVKKENGRITFKKFSPVYLEDYAMIQKKAWERSDKVYLNASLIPYFGRYEIRKITQHSIEQFIKERLKTRVKKSSINRELSCLSKMFNKAIDWKYLSENPMACIKRFSEKDSMRERVASEEEYEQLLERSSPHLKPILLTERYTGMRISEILNLKWSQIDLITRKIRVENTKSKKNRHIEINPVLLDVLLKLRTGQSPYVFPNPKTGKPYTTIKTAFKAACRRAGIENLRFHDLRHTFGTRLIENGVDVETVRDLMGHHSIVVTQRYLHTNEERRRQAVESLTKKRTKKVQICYTNCYTGKKQKKGKSLNGLFSVN